MWSGLCCPLWPDLLPLSPWISPSKQDSTPSKQDFSEPLKHAIPFHLKLCPLLSPWASHFPSPPQFPPGQHCNFTLFETSGPKFNFKHYFSNTLTELEWTYNKLHIFKMCNLISFNICIYQWNHHNQDIYRCIDTCMRAYSVAQSCPTLWTIARQAPSSMEFSRQEYWSGLLFPSPEDPPDPGIKPTSPVIPGLAGGFFTTSATWEAAYRYIDTYI